MNAPLTYGAFIVGLALIVYFRRGKNPWRTAAIIIGALVLGWLASVL